MRPFVYQALPTRVTFGIGSLQRLPDEMRALSCSRAMVLSTPEQSDLATRIAALLGDACVGVFAKAAMHVPIEIARNARAAAVEVSADCVIAVGGGSTIGLGKAIALESTLPVIAVPTTYAGSEMTPIYGVTEAGLKKTGRDLRVLPRSVLYEPELTLSLPPRMALTSAFNAIAHAAEGLYAPDSSPITALMAEEGIRASVEAMDQLQVNPADIEARSRALYAAWLCGAVLGSVSMGIHHKLCHTLGGSFNLPHADVHCVILPHALAYNAMHAEHAMQITSRSLGSPHSGPASSAQAVFALLERHGAPRSLREIGMPEDGLDRAADLAFSDEYPNPRPLERAALRALLQRAFDGEPPRV